MVEIILQVAVLLVSVGGVYGAIRTDLKGLHEKAAAQAVTNEKLWTRASEIDNRINDHIERHHLKAK